MIMCIFKVGPQMSIPFPTSLIPVFLPSSPILPSLLILFFFSLHYPIPINFSSFFLCFLKVKLKRGQKWHWDRVDISSGYFNIMVCFLWTSSTLWSNLGAFLSIQIFIWLDNLIIASKITLDFYVKRIS